MEEGRRESLLFYKYLCHKIGTQVDVRTRRLSFIICDIHNHPLKRNSFKYFPEISSGSRAEGLNLSGSDVDIMLIDNRFEVYESENEAVQGRKLCRIGYLKYSQDSRDLSLMDMFYTVKFLEISHQMIVEPLNDITRQYSKIFNNTTGMIDIY
ncbi:unnamed protein product [Mytilus edulis]|uniref:Uncharacterized protein n=1 Tax=Mytilus edulis TaxID=6550 RepID=A0A8S3SF65_MYTED|nr:unnamed protein product [Mytilus edulis]